MASQPRGQCAFCGHETTKGSMSQHLAACPGRRELVAGADAEPAKPETLVQLRMQDGYGGGYWLDAEVRGTATLEDIDGYLRKIWLDCCGHMSRFSLGGWDGKDISLQRRVDAALTDGVELTHIYDFGTESVTLVKATGRRHAAPLTPHPILLMARNLAVVAPCMECDRLATHFCQECRIEEDLLGTLCARHTKTHPHEDYGEPVEIVNSPRMGMCGYTGPADPPY